MFIKALCIVAILVSAPLYAQDYQLEFFREFIEKDDPDTLDYWYTHGEACPWSESEGTEVITGVLKRSRVLPTQGLGKANGVYLFAKSTCLELAHEFGFAVNFYVVFGEVGDKGSIVYDKDYGGLGSGAPDDKRFFLDSLRSSVEAAVTDFIEVNFLLDDQ
ncbi:MAG: hypothetical protein ACE37D_11570 [Pseudomonadales bacterium]